MARCDIVVIEPEDFSGTFPVATILTLLCNGSSPEWDTDCSRDCFPIINYLNARVSTTDRTEDNAGALTFADEGSYSCLNDDNFTDYFNISVSGRSTVS